MGSIYTTMPGKTIKGFAGKEYSVPMFMQFVPGYVVEVVHNDTSLRYNTDKSINSIIAIPHISDKLYKKRASAGEDSRYFPLLRTFNDVPSKGDPVLLCTIGNINYYLGPLNTINNSPNWNDDPSYTPEPLFTDGGTDSELGEVGPRGLRGEGKNFVKTTQSRLQKAYNSNLEIANFLNETSGDTILEGRHGNSLRIGSVGAKPYVFISNKRSVESQYESLGDGSLISITSDSTLQQHFEVFTDSLNSRNIFGFTLSSDLFFEGEEPKRFLGTLVSNVNNNQDTQDLIYNYNNNQMLLHSDRITLNSKLDDIYLSSIKDIHIGTKRHLTISTNEDLIISSERTFIGNPTLNGESREMESMVLGTTLLELLNETLDVIKNSQGICQGAPIALADETGVVGGVNQKITDIQNRINTILSTKHFIEPNT
tara:strand:+ start:137 stop:1414 length:1278 start_codon:yes stop_codon:yes gene_type:complete